MSGHRPVIDAAGVEHRPGCDLAGWATRGEAIAGTQVHECTTCGAVRLVTA